MSALDTIDAAPPDATTGSPTPTYVLTISCPDRPGIVFTVSEFLVIHACTIIESQQFNDRRTRTFFMRVQFEAVSGENA